MPGPWDALGQAANLAQLAGLDAFGLISMIAQAALAARRHRDACQQFARHAEVVGGLLLKLEISELAERPETRRPLEQLREALRRACALVRACQDDGYLRRLLGGARELEELREAQREIDFYIRLIPLLALVGGGNGGGGRVGVTEEVPRVVKICSDHGSRPGVGLLESTEKGAGGVIGQPLAGKLHEQKVISMEEAMKHYCTEESCLRFTKFEFSQMVDATDNFSQNIGQGGFGTVYKGRLPDGLEVAVKRLGENATLLEFKNEIRLARLQHKNLVRFLGWCIHEEATAILVYEFVRMGSLQPYISDKTKKLLLNWSRRVQIIQGIAEGLVYLHKHFELCIVHCDLKPSNILLDHNFNPKIADFGSARTLSSDTAEEYTDRVVGTSGYMAPEYVSHGNYSVKSDVFSFGVILLGIISGQSNVISNQQGDDVCDLIGHAWHLWKEGRLQELVDPSLCDAYQTSEMLRCVQVALLCVQDDPACRPTMSDVVAMLHSEKLNLCEPKQPVGLAEGARAEASSKICGSLRTIDLTITCSAPTPTRVRILIGPDGR